MKLLISPAKKMRAEDFLPPRTQPPLLEKSAQLLNYVRGLSLPQLKRLLACNESLAQEAFENFRTMELGRGTTPALLAYDGIQYKYMAPGVFTQAQLEYVGEHLRILSGFYGVLRPFDGVSPYRLEMQAKVKAPFCKNLYDFWGTPWGSFCSKRILCWSTWPPRSTPRPCARRWRGRGGLSPVSSPRSRSPAGWWKRASTSRWPVGRWCASPQSTTSNPPRACRAFPA